LFVEVAFHDTRIAAVVKHSGPLLGYNNNIPHLGNVFHVQTEDSGTKRPHVITHLFADGGRIVKTLKTSYAQYVSAENVTEKVRALMRDQHKSMVLSLRDGEFDHLIEEGRAEIEERDAPRSMPPPSVESIDVPASAPLELLERAASVNEREFHQEMERLTTTPASPESVRRASAPTGEGPGTYSFVGRGAPPARERSAPPQRSSPPSAGKPSASGPSAGGPSGSSASGSSASGSSASGPSASGPAASGAAASGAIPRREPRRMRSTRPPDDSNPPREEDAPPALDVTNPRRMRSTRDGPPDSENRATSVYKRDADHVRTKPDLKAAHEHAAVASPFGERFVSARRFDEVVAAFIARGE
jgi:hypothetical protein